jgi:hypothetical protein
LRAHVKVPQYFFVRSHKSIAKLRKPGRGDRFPELFFAPKKLEKFRKSADFFPFSFSSHPETTPKVLLAHRARFLSSRSTWLGASSSSRPLLFVT